jgi:LemA protein
LLAVAENYPELKANQNFLTLQAELTNTEDRIQAARRFYNANVQDYNRRVKAFPSAVVARMFNFEEEEFFQIPEAEQAIVGQAPRVDFAARGDSGTAEALSPPLPGRKVGPSGPPTQAQPPPTS